MTYLTPKDLRTELQAAQNRMNAIILSYDNQWDTDGDLSGKITKIEELLTTNNQKLAALENDMGDDTKITKLLEELEISNKKFTSLRIERDQISSEFTSFKDKSAQVVDDLNSRVTNLQTELQDFEKSKLEVSETMSKSISIRFKDFKVFLPIFKLFQWRVTLQLKNPNKRISHKNSYPSAET